MNKSFYTNIDKDFELACDLVNKKLSHDECIYFLKNGNLQEKQLAALLLDTVNNLDESSALVANLVGCDGKIREAVALKINQILLHENELSNLFNYPEIFAKASIDINGNICRSVADTVRILKSNNEFSEKYLSEILKFIEESFEELDKFIFRDKKYVINKQLFKLYWCLENLKLFANSVEEGKLHRILSRAASEKEYTIREKVAEIVVNLDSEIFCNLKNELADDENYYVKSAMQRCLNHPSITN